MRTLLQQLRVIVGIILCVVGLAGTLLPVVPGVPILLAGVALMGSEHPLVRIVRERFKHWLDRDKRQSS